MKPEIIALLVAISKTYGFEKIGHTGFVESKFANELAVLQQDDLLKLEQAITAMHKKSSNKYYSKETYGFEFGHGQSATAAVVSCAIIDTFLS